MFEHRSQPLLSRCKFFIRMLRSSAIVFGLIALSLLVGTVGYRITGDLPWIDAFYNASLIMSGMGPADPLTSNSAKIFASLYSIYSGMFLIGASGLLLAPLFHRLIHKFHVEKNKE